MHQVRSHSQSPSPAAIPRLVLELVGSTRAGQVRQHYEAIEYTSALTEGQRKCPQRVKPETKWASINTGKLLSEAIARVPRRENGTPKTVIRVNTSTTRVSEMECADPLRPHALCNSRSREPSQFGRTIPISLRLVLRTGRSSIDLTSSET